MAARKKAARKKAAKKPAGSGATSPGPVKPPWGEILTGNFGAKLYRRRGKAGAPIARVRGVKATTGKTKAGTSKTKAGTSKTKARTARPKAGRAADTETRVRTSNFGAKKRARRK